MKTEKKLWKQPEANVQKFCANEYVAACWTVRCELPDKSDYVSGKSYDPLVKSTAVLHQAAFCGSQESWAIELDEEGNPKKLVEVFPGSSRTPIDAKLYYDEACQSPRDIDTVEVGDTLYFTTTTNKTTWTHKGTVSATENHS